MGCNALPTPLSEVLGAHGYPAEDSVLFVGDALLETLNDTAQEIHPRVFLADRLVTGRGWWTVGSSSGSCESGQAHHTVLDQGWCRA